MYLILQSKTQVTLKLPFLINLWMKRKDFNQNIKMRVPTGMMYKWQWDCQQCDLEIQIASAQKSKVYITIIKRLICITIFRETEQMCIHKKHKNRTFDSSFNSIFCLNGQPTAHIFHSVKFPFVTELLTMYTLTKHYVYNINIYILIYINDNNSLELLILARVTDTHSQISMAKKPNYQLSAVWQN